MQGFAHALVCDLDKLVAVRLNPDGSRMCMPFVAAARGLMIESTFILLGDTGLGKTALARSMCQLFCKAKGVPYFIESNTVDSLRTVYINGFFRKHVPVLLDEWKPTGDKYSGRDGIDMLKCLNTVGDAATIKCRYSDIRFQDDQPKVQSCNCASLDAWCECLGEVDDVDKNAVLRRCLFVEITESLVPEALRAEFLGKRRESCVGEMSSAAVAQGCDIANEPSESDLRFRPMINVKGTWKAGPLYTSPSPRD